MLADGVIAIIFIILAGVLLFSHEEEIQDWQNEIIKR